MTVAEYVAKFLAAQGVTHAFELSGGMITHLLDAIVAHGETKLVDMRHEQAAGFAAEGWARMTGKPGVAFATSGPGATNLLTAIGSCYFDSTPAVFITGQVPTKELKQDRGVRQLGFQETDIVSMARPVTKAAWAVNTPVEVPGALRNAFRFALDGRPGPVLLDIPLDVSQAEIPAALRAPARVAPVEYLPTSSARQITDLLQGAQRPLVLVGGGCASPRVRPAVRRLLSALNLPVVTSLMGLDVPVTGFVGFIGSYGNRWANWALQNCDVLLVLGSRLDVRQTGANVRSFLAGKRVLHVDVDVAEINGGRVSDAPEVQRRCDDLVGFCTAVAEEYPTPPLGGTKWREEINERRDRWRAGTELQVPPNTINPNVFMSRLGNANPDAAAFVLDVGAHQMWAAQSLDIHSRQRVITSGGMGSMGWALPAAIGAAFACPGKPIVCVTGDGGMQVNIQELQTIADYQLPIRIVVLSNGGHAMVRQFQDQYFDGRHVATRPRAPSFWEIAMAYRIPSDGIDSPEGVEGFDRFFTSTKGPALLEVAIDSRVGIAPKMAYGKRLDEMDPPRE